MCCTVAIGNIAGGRKLRVAGQRAWGRGHGAEGIGQRAWGRGQRAEGMGQRAEGMHGAEGREHRVGASRRG